MSAHVLWPERESLYDLMLLRATIGPAAFNSEKQNDPHDPSLCEWPPEYFDYAGFWFDDWPPCEIKTLSLDPSKGRDARHGDYSAYVCLGRDKHQVLHVEADLRRDRDSSVIVADGVEHVKRFGPEGFAVEVNQFQELLLVQFEEAARQAKIHLPIYTVENMVPKPVRIRRLGPYLHQHKMRFRRRSPGTLLLVQQLRDFGPASADAHDDGPDSLEQGLRIMIEIWNEQHS